MNSVSKEEQELEIPDEGKDDKVMKEGGDIEGKDAKGALEVEDKDKAEKQALAQAIHEAEKTHYRPKAHCISLVITIFLILIKVLRGSKNVDSIVGMETCSGADWGLLVAFVIFCAIMSVYTLNNF